jgi:hypothetical protein
MPKKKEKVTETVKPLQKFLDLAQKRLKREIDADSHNRTEAIESLRFLNGEQWDAAEKTRRKRFNRPCLTINLLPKYVAQVVGDMRQNRVRVKIRAVDSKADVNIAKIRAGIISNIEYLSNAESIYDQAGEMQVSCGYGAWRVLTRYTEENPFIEEVYLQTIPNPFCVYMDSDSKDLMYADATYGFILDKMPREEFEEKYPDAEIPGEPIKTGQGLSQEHWYDTDTVTIAEYFNRESVKKTVCLMNNGEVLDKDEANEKIRKWKEDHPPIPEVPISPIAGMPPSPIMTPPTPPPTPAPPIMGMPPAPPTASQAPPPVPPMGAMPSPQAQGMPPTSPGAPQIPPKPAMPPTPPKPPEEEPKIEKERETEEYEIRHYVITALEILSKGGLKGEKIPGKYIPIILVRGRQRNIEGKTFVYALIKDGKDSIRLVNYWNTSAAEVVALAPKVPWIGTAKQFEGYEEDYANANIENFPFLKYNVDPDTPETKPTQNAPAQVPTAMFAQIVRAEENVKNTIGMYNRDVGQSGPERTGAAITQAQKPSDVGTFAFIDNLRQAIAHNGRIINEMIPEVYDTERDVRIRNLDDSEQYVPVNTTVENALKMIRDDPERYKGMDQHQLKMAIKHNLAGAKFNDLTVGKYDVIVTTGPSFSTQRAEAAQSMTALAQANPKLFAIGGDLMVKAMDFLYADELSERLKKTLPPGLVQPQEGEAPPTPLPPPPAIQVKLAELELKKVKIQVEMEKVKIQKIKALKEVQDAKGEVRKIILDVLKEVYAPVHPADKLINQGMSPMGMTGMEG